MNTIDLFFQGEGLDEVKHLEIDEDITFAMLKTRLVERHGFREDVLIFIEDEDEPIDDLIALRARATSKRLKVHLHRRREVNVAVSFNEKTARRRFGPSTTVARVKRWAAEREFGMSPLEASEHMLQISGTHDRPSASTHIGALIEREQRVLSFDLVPDERVQGFPQMVP